VEELIDFCPKHCFQMEKHECERSERPIHIVYEIIALDKIGFLADYNF
jgi:hypothetical protein